MPKAALPERILIVDDGPEARASLEAHLKLRGYEVLTASSGLEAQAILVRQKIGCMIWRPGSSVPVVVSSSLAGSLAMPASRCWC